MLFYGVGHGNGWQDCWMYFGGEVYEKYVEGEFDYWVFDEYEGVSFMGCCFESTVLP